MEESKKQSVYKIIMLVVLTAIITAIITSIFMYKYLPTTVNISTIKSEEDDIGTVLANFKKVIDKCYLGEVDEKSLIDGAIKGYIEGLKDPYSEYFTKEELEEYKEETLGNFVGIGVYMVKDTEKNVIRVLSPIQDSPAFEIGILPGDIISKVDGKTYTGDEMSEASKVIKGTENTKVNIEIIREGEVLQFEIERKIIKVNHVEAKKLENDIGYLKLSTFDEGCSDEFKQKYEELKKQNITSLIIDLRNNGGGIVDEALNIADYMTEKDSILLITQDKNGKEQINKAKQSKLIDVPIIILINENSASASEILAGALKDNNVARTVGTKTYGKGVIQELMTLSDGSGLKITTNEYYTPNRNKINKVGIEPDEEVKLPEDVENILKVDESKDTQLQKAIEILK